MKALEAIRKRLIVFLIRGMKPHGELRVGSVACSCCGKRESEVEKLIAGPSVFICDRCVSLCNDETRRGAQEKHNGSDT